MQPKGFSDWFVLIWKNKKAGEILIQSKWDNDETPEAKTDKI